MNKELTKYINDPCGLFRAMAQMKACNFVNPYQNTFWILNQNFGVKSAKNRTEHILNVFISLALGIYLLKLWRFFLLHDIVLLPKTTVPQQLIFSGKLSTIIIFKLCNFNANLWILCFVLKLPVFPLFFSVIFFLLMFFSSLNFINFSSLKLVLPYINFPFWPYMFLFMF